MFASVFLHPLRFIVAICTEVLGPLIHVFKIDMILDIDLTIYDYSMILISIIFATCQDCWKVVFFACIMFLFNQMWLWMCVCVSLILLILLEPSPFLSAFNWRPSFSCPRHARSNRSASSERYRDRGSLGQMQPPLTLTPSPLHKFLQVMPRIWDRYKLKKVGEKFDMPGLHGFAASLGTL